MALAGGEVLWGETHSVVRWTSEITCENVLDPEVEAVELTFTWQDPSQPPQVFLISMGDLRQKNFRWKIIPTP